MKIATKSHAVLRVLFDLQGFEGEESKLRESVPEHEIRARAQILECHTFDGDVVLGELRLLQAHGFTKELENGWTLTPVGELITSRMTWPERYARRLQSAALSQ